MTKEEYIEMQIEDTDNSFINKLLYEYYDSQVKNMSKKEFEEHLEDIGIEK